MSHIVEVPDELYRKIERYAAERNQDPESLIASWAAEAMRRTETPQPIEAPISDGSLASDEPLALLAGIVSVPDADAGDHHDRYVGADER